MGAHYPKEILLPSYLQDSLISSLHLELLLICQCGRWGSHSISIATFAIEDTHLSNDFTGQMSGIMRSTSWTVPEQIWIRKTVAINSGREKKFFEGMFFLGFMIYAVSQCMQKNLFWLNAFDFWAFILIFPWKWFWLLMLTLAVLPIIQALFIGQKYENLQTDFNTYKWLISSQFSCFCTLKKE